MPALEAQGVSKSFGGTVALDAINFTADSGEVHGLVGENGAGKSTFVKIVVGALRADSGEISVFGEALREFSPRRAADLGISTVLQEVALIPDLTVSQSVWFRHEPRSRLAMISDRQLGVQTEELFDRIRIRHVDPNAMVRDLALPDRQLVDIARAVARRPRILILDEATSALSHHEVDWTFSLAKQIAEDGGLVIFISHRLREVRQVADRVTIFRNGHAVGMHRIDEISDDELIESMLGRPPRQLYPPRTHELSSELALELRGLSVPGRLHEVDLVIRRGEIVGIGGLQGQGQTDLLLALCGALAARGEIHVGGRRVRMRNPKRALRAGIALIPEDRQRDGLLLTKSIRFNTSLSILDQLSAVGLLHLGREAKIVRSISSRLNVKARDIDQIVGTLSGGNQQKVLTGRVLLTRARILLLNDPVRGVDVGTKAEIFSLFRELTSAGYSLLFHSTDFQELVSLADRLVIFRDGEVGAILAGDELTEPNALRASVGTAA